MTSMATETSLRAAIVAAAAWGLAYAYAELCRRRYADGASKRKALTYPWLVEEFPIFGEGSGYEERVLATSGLQVEVVAETCTPDARAKATGRDAKDRRLRRWADSELQADSSGAWGLNAAAGARSDSAGGSPLSQSDQELSDCDERIASLFALMTNIMFSPADQRRDCCCSSRPPRPASHDGSPPPPRGRCPQCGGPSAGSPSPGAGAAQASSPCPAAARGFERCRVRSNLSFNAEEMEDEAAGAGGEDQGYACGSAPCEGRYVLRTCLTSTSIYSGGSSSSRGSGAGLDPHAAADSEHARLGRWAVTAYLQERKQGRPPLPPTCTALTPVPSGVGRPSVVCDLDGDSQLQGLEQWGAAAPQTPPPAPATPDLIPPGAAVLLTPAPAESPIASEAASASEGVSLEGGLGPRDLALAAGSPAASSRRVLLRQISGDVLGADEACSRPSSYAWATPAAALRGVGPSSSSSPPASPGSVSRASLASASTTASAASASSSTSRASVGARAAHSASANKAAAEAAAKLGRRRLAREQAQLMASSAGSEGFMRATAASVARSTKSQ
ncbi:hypothetical protein TSOC_005691 [Tetrabaena socialis]|uniref:Uncharacterized protein n=1 Tax=Tetrabaena socialis TaxID=47790 RepID=A0A2J8A5M5_9CHLO|nr:hypothetical protein TSOC_005691 [Tetrabaena socialis]|eukprot:PNH07803.1 hypothetical protein TSOC_005691 [Tetrabaena socialis]